MEPIKLFFSLLLAVAMTGCVSVSPCGDGQIIEYSKDPDKEGLKPGNPNRPALAYPKGDGSLQTWSTKKKLWNP